MNEFGGKALGGSLKEEECETDEEEYEIKLRTNSGF